MATSTSLALQSILLDAGARSGLTRRVHRVVGLSGSARALVAAALAHQHKRVTRTAKQWARRTLIIVHHRLRTTKDTCSLSSLAEKKARPGVVAAPYHEFAFGKDEVLAVPVYPNHQANQSALRLVSPSQ